jgi:hypothetical protein
MSWRFQSLAETLSRWACEPLHHLFTSPLLGWNYLSEWNDMSTRGLSLNWVITVKIKLSLLIYRSSTKWTSSSHRNVTFFSAMIWLQNCSFGVKQQSLIILTKSKLILTENMTKYFIQQSFIFKIVNCELFNRNIVK